MVDEKTSDLLNTATIPGTYLLPWANPGVTNVKQTMSQLKTQLESELSITPGGSTTQVQFNNAGSFAGDSNFTWDNTNKRLGIGTTSPGAKLEIETGAAATKGLIVQGAAAQTANLQEWQDSAGTVLSAITATGELDLNGNNIIDLSDITFKTGAVGGTIRTGTSAADKFVLQAYDVNGAAYQTALELDAGNEPVLQLRADFLEIDDQTDTTKRVLWDISGATTATATTLDFIQTAARTITFPDATGTVALTASPTFTGTTTVDKMTANQTISFDAETDNGNSSTADTIDWGAGNKQKSTLTGNCTFTFTAPAGLTNVVLKLVQDATGSRTVTWPASVLWPGGTAPTLSTAAASVDIVSFYYDGTNYFGQAGLAFS